MPGELPTDSFSEFSENSEFNEETLKAEVQKYIEETIKEKESSIEKYRQNTQITESQRQKFIESDKQYIEWLRSADEITRFKHYSNNFWMYLPGTLLYRDPDTLSPEELKTGPFRRSKDIKTAIENLGYSI